MGQRSVITGVPCPSNWHGNCNGCRDMGQRSVITGVPCPSNWHGNCNGCRDMGQRSVITGVPCPSNWHGNRTESRSYSDTTKPIKMYLNTILNETSLIR
ncbi:hypothetical protein AVEN_50415-1 [Araneus ventricosus]|uniref:Uncharacterized protein n=1 Tax=Araneus ventricosus TaxID=182803 RepID=A0A4Y2ESY8_ARAVE|nr:hypothetical protein AVEN_50415-1 [Araneus ventricosus]